MDNQPSNVNFYDNLGEWLELPANGEPLGQLATNGWDGWLTENPRDPCQSKPETESEYLAIRVLGEIGSLGDRWMSTLMAI